MVRYLVSRLPTQLATDTACFPLRSSAAVGLFSSWPIGVTLANACSHHRWPTSCCSRGFHVNGRFVLRPVVSLYSFTEKKNRHGSASTLWPRSPHYQPRMSTFADLLYGSWSDDVAFRLASNRIDHGLTARRRHDFCLHFSAFAAGWKHGDSALS